MGFVHICVPLTLVGKTETPFALATFFVRNT